MKKAIVFAAIIAALGIAPFGCHGQVPPSPTPVVNLTWTASTSCTGGAPCTYVISRATVPAGTPGCPSTTGTTYTPLNQSSPATGTTFTDSAPTALVCYTAQTVQSGLTSTASAASNSGTPLAVPVVPLAPGPPNATATADLVKPNIFIERPAVVYDAALSAPVRITATVKR